MSGRNTHPNKATPATTRPPTSNVCQSNRLGCDNSCTWAGAKTVAGVAEAAAADAGAIDIASAGEAIGFDSATAADSEGIAEEAGEAAAVTGVSTTGDTAGTGTAGISSGFAGVPAAKDSLGMLAGGCKTVAGAGFSACDAVASIPAIAGVATGDAVAEVCAFDSFACSFFASTTPGMGLGSIAGLDSVCVDSIATAASVGGAGEVPSDGVCSQPRS